MTFVPSFASPKSAAPPMLRSSGVLMDTSAGEITQVTGERIANELRRVEPNSTAKNVSRKVGIPYRTVERWLDGTSTPRLPQFAKLLLPYPSLLLILLPDVPWVGEVVEILEHDKFAAHLATRSSRRQRAADALRGRR